MATKGTTDCLWNQSFFKQLSSIDGLLTLLDTLPDAYFFAKDLDGRFMAMNSVLARSMGVADPQSILGKTDYDFFDRDLADAYRAEDQRVMATRQPVLNEVWHVPSAAGDMHWFIASKVPLLDHTDRAIGIAGLMRAWLGAEELDETYRRMGDVFRFMEANLDRKVAVAELADAAGLSVRHFQRQFKQVFRLTPKEQMSRIRVRAAAGLLEQSGDSLAEIASQCGFYDQSHFTHQFTRLRGMTPSEYRRKFQGQSR